MGKLSQFREYMTKHIPKKHVRTKPSNDMEIPEDWLDDKPNLQKETSKGMVTVKFPTSHAKIHIPGLRTSKRVLATIMVAFNFFIAQTALMSNPNTQPLAFLFYLNCFILIDYVWKTRKNPKRFMEIQE